MTQEVIDEHAEKYFMKPLEEPAWVRFKRMLYNPKTGSILGRTPFLWGRVFVFYLVFYTALAGMFTGMMKGLMYTIDETKPRYTLGESRIGTSPGLGYRPTAVKYNPTSSLIRYEAGSRNNTITWTNDIEEFLEVYKNPEMLPGGGRNIQNCSYDEHLKSGNVCAVDMTGWEPCTNSMGYGFNDSTPCIFIKLNRIFDWIPEYYNDLEKLPEKMPVSLKEEIRRSVAQDPKTINTVWLSCSGENPADRENIGELHYIPRQGFPGYYFPYKNVPGYLSPLVAVHFKNPTPNVIINIECKAWARNIIYHHQTQMGSCHFELLIDTPNGFYQ